MCNCTQCLDACSSDSLRPNREILYQRSIETYGDTEYITGLGTIEDRMLILVDIERLMSSADMGLIEKMAA